MNDKDVNVLGLVTKLGLNRRQFLAATTGMAAAAAVSAPSALAAPGSNGVLVPPAKRGIILYTVRDAISRDPASSPFASGFKEVFEELARIGYKQIEFAGFSQHANAPGGNVNNPAGAALLRTWLDDNGLEAEGNHGNIPGFFLRPIKKRAVSIKLKCPDLQNWYSLWETHKPVR